MNNINLNTLTKTEQLIKDMQAHRDHFIAHSNGQTLLQKIKNFNTVIHEVGNGNIKKEDLPRYGFFYFEDLKNSTPEKLISFMKPFKSVYLLNSPYQTEDEKEAKWQELLLMIEKEEIGLHDLPDFHFYFFHSFSSMSANELSACMHHNKEDYISNLKHNTEEEKISHWNWLNFQILSEDLGFHDLPDFGYYYFSSTHMPERENLFV